MEENEMKNELDFEAIDAVSMEFKKKKRKKFLLDTAGFIVILLLIWLVVYGITHFLYGFIIVDGSSMTNTLKDGQVGIIQKIDSEKDLKRGDIVVFWSDELSEYLIKRCVAVKGDSIEMEAGVLKVNGKVVKEDYIKEPMQGNDEILPTTLKKNQFFAMGDNRNGSYDCRDLGPVSYGDLSGILVINLGKYGITKKSAIGIVVAIFAVFLLFGLISDVKLGKKLKQIPKEFQDFNVEFEESEDGEIRIGFRNPETRQLELCETVQGNEGIKAYCTKYGQEYKYLLKK